MSISSIKQAIKTNLDELVTAGVIGGVTTSDIKKNPLDQNVPSWPHAYIMPPGMTGEILDNRTIMRTYSFDIAFLFKAIDLASTEALETAIESILNKFDNDPTLSGFATGGMPPVASAPAPYNHNGNDLIMVVVQVHASEAVSLSFS